VSNISDIIEEFLMQTMGDANTIDISRNDLANYFNVAPSQINYVLTTRFNFERGYMTESKRGGGGHITISKAKGNTDEWLSSILNNTLKNEIDYRNSIYLLEELVDRDILNKDEAEILQSTLSNNALNNPFKVENKLRANIIKKVIIDKIQKGGEL